MTQLERLKIRIPEEQNDNILEDFLLSSKLRILARRNPFSEIKETDELESQYYDLQIRLAVQMYNMHGAEGESSHSENGISRTYESYDMLLKEVAPKAKVL